MGNSLLRFMNYEKTVSKLRFYQIHWKWRPPWFVKEPPTTTTIPCKQTHIAVKPFCFQAIWSLNVFIALGATPPWEEHMYGINSQKKDINNSGIFHLHLSCSTFALFLFGKKYQASSHFEHTTFVGHLFVGCFPLLTVTARCDRTSPLRPLVHRFTWRLQWSGWPRRLQRVPWAKRAELMGGCMMVGSLILAGRDPSVSVRECM